MNKVDQYIQKFSKEVQVPLNQIRKEILELAPESTEGISYGMPAYKLEGKPLVYFAAFKHHVGFYATPSGHAKFSKELAAYEHGKGSVQFPIDEALPLELIRKIIQFRVKENKALKSK